jgi:glycosyltransferase involved in cell wall biosynthesis
MPTPLRLLLVSNLYPPDTIGGYELLARDLAEGFVARGHEVTLITSGKGPSSGSVRRVLSLSRSFAEPARRDRLRHLVAAVKNRRVIRQILADEPRPDAALLLSLRRLGPAPMRELARARVPFVVTVNDDWPVAYAPAPFVPTLRGVAAWVADRIPGAAHTFRGVPIRDVVYLSGAIRDRVRASGVPLPVGRVESQGVDTRLFCPDPAVARVPGEILLVGRLHPSKAPDAAIDAVATLRRAGREVRLSLVGAPVTDAYGRELRARAVEQGVEDAVRFVGAVPREQLPDLYRRADVALFLTRWDGEAQGLVPLEAMACGALVVSHALGGAEEFLRGSGATIQAATCDGPGIAAAVARGLDDPQARAEALARGVHLVKTRGSLDRYVDALEASLESAWRARRTP